MFSKEDYMLGLSYFLILGLCDSSANCWFVTILLLIVDSSAFITAPPEAFL